MSHHFVNELRAVFDARAAKPAIVQRDRIVTYGELGQSACRFAAWLQSSGVAPGDRVALFTDNKLPFLTAHLGVLFAGGVPLPLNPRFTREEMRYFLGDSEARVVIADDKRRALMQTLAPELPHRPLVVLDSAVGDPPAASFREPVLRGDDPCLMLYSSGTTGWPKGVVHTQTGAASALGALKTCWRMTADDVVVNVLPLFHIHGLAFATHLTWLAGGCIWIEETFEVPRTVEAIGQGTVFMAVPAIYVRLLEDATFRAAARSWQNVRLFTCGSAPIRAEILPELESILGQPVVNRYGMTEAYVITSLPLDGPWPAGSVGLPLDGIERKVIRPDGTPVAAGEVGTVVIRGPNLFREYWRKPDATQAALSSGWFDTGDLGTLDEAGFLTLVGRKNDLIITSGYNVYPQVVERVIGECPGVRECAVLGVPDARRGELVAAAVVRNETTLDEARLRAWSSERLVHYQQPRILFFVDALPRNSMGKILRRELREQALKAGDQDD
ncbi:MAG TPA: AMP-binding protein [Planctomycetaceae bacterium]|jgi:malonyl-CoA/methylmalonyl-CoA synthetase|nr:AMP-binding protein [Planctomycetaceae bacterium]